MCEDGEGELPQRVSKADLSFASPKICKFDAEWLSRLHKDVRRFDVPMRKFDRMEIFESLKEEMHLWIGLPSACLYLVPFGCVYRASISSFEHLALGVCWMSQGSAPAGWILTFTKRFFLLSISPCRGLYIPPSVPRRRERNMLAPPAERPANRRGC